MSERHQQPQLKRAGVAGIVALGACGLTSGYNGAPGHDAANGPVPDAFVDRCGSAGNGWIEGVIPGLAGVRFGAVTSARFSDGGGDTGFGFDLSDGAHRLSIFRFPPHETLAPGVEIVGDGTDPLVGPSDVWAAWILPVGPSYDVTAVSMKGELIHSGLENDCASGSFNIVMMPNTVSSSSGTGVSPPSHVLPPIDGAGWILTGEFHARLL